MSPTHFPRPTRVLMSADDDRPRGIDMAGYEALPPKVLKEVNAWCQRLPLANRSAVRVELLNLERTRVRVTHYVTRNGRKQLSRTADEPAMATTDLTAPEPFPASAIFVLGPAE